MAPKINVFHFFRGPRFEDTFGLDFWQWSNPQSTRHGAVETHVGLFGGKSARRSIFDTKRPQKRPHKSIKTIKRAFEKNTQLSKASFKLFCGFWGCGVWVLEHFWSPFSQKNDILSRFFRCSNFISILNDFWGHFDHLGKDLGWFLGTFVGDIRQMFPKVI